MNAWTTMAGPGQVGREHCFRHETPQNVTMWPFASHFRDRVHLKKKVPLGVRLISTRRRRPRVFCKTNSRGPEINSLDRGCGVGRPPCKGVAIGVARRGALLGGDRALRIIPPSCSGPVSHAGGPHVASFVRRSSVRTGAPNQLSDSGGQYQDM